MSWSLTIFRHTYFPQNIGLAKTRPTRLVAPALHMQKKIGAHKQFTYTWAVYATYSSTFSGLTHKLCSWKWHHGEPVADEWAQRHLEQWSIHTRPHYTVKNYLSILHDNQKSLRFMAALGKHWTTNKNNTSEHRHVWSACLYVYSPTFSGIHWWSIQQKVDENLIINSFTLRVFSVVCVCVCGVKYGRVIVCHIHVCGFSTAFPTQTDMGNLHNNGILCRRITLAHVQHTY